MIVQGSPEWLAARAGKVTASRLADVIGKQKDGKTYLAARANYLFELLCERLSGASEPGFVSREMLWGTEQEPFARQAYEARCGVEVYEVGFVDHPEIAMSGASPDGFVLEDGLVEIKAPLTSTHVATLDSGTVPSRYVTQIQWQLACTGRAWCDFVSYDPRLPPGLQLFVKRVPRDVSMILELEGEVVSFLRELDAKVARLSADYGLPAAA